jgi:acyl-CoA thioester hydrolase
MRKRHHAVKGFFSGPDVPQPLTVSVPRTVRFQEVDLMGVVWHGRYAEYFEDGRSAVGRTFGLDYRDFFREGIKAPVVNFEIEYGRSLLPGDTFRIETSLHWSEAVRLNHNYLITRETDGQLMARGSTVQLLLDGRDRLLLVWPEYFQQLREKWRRGELTATHG